MTGSKRGLGGWLAAGFLLAIPAVAPAMKKPDKATAGQVRVYVGTYTRKRQQGDLCLAPRSGHRRAAAARAGRGNDQSVVRGYRSLAAVSLRGGRGRSLRRPERRGPERVRRRCRVGQAHALEPAVHAGSRAVPCDGRSHGPLGAGGQLRRRKRGLSAHPEGRAARRGNLLFPARRARASTPNASKARTPMPCTSTPPTASSSCPTLGWIR